MISDNIDLLYDTFAVNARITSAKKKFSKTADNKNSGTRAARPAVRG